MTYSLTWLPEVLLDAKLKVAEVPGWEDRGHGDVGPTFGVLCHQTAGRKTGNMPALRTLVEGRTDLKGPLAQLGLGRDGTFYVIAAGKAHHAGAGVWMGAREGNTNFIGIEAENTGLRDDPWPTVQLDAYKRGVAAILRHARLGPERCAGHKEYALPRGRKPDPWFDMAAFRADVAAILADVVPAPALIPAREPAPRGSAPARPTLRRDSLGHDAEHTSLVRALQAMLGLPLSGVFDAATEARARVFQREHRLVPDGIVGPKTWTVVDARTQGPSPVTSRGTHDHQMQTGTRAMLVGPR